MGRAPDPDSITITHPDKVLFPGDGFTKADLARYYRDGAGAMLPRLTGRPVTMIRYPDGIGSHAILQKNAPDYFPDWIPRAEVGKQGGTVHHVICDSPAALVYLASQACVELHVFLSRTDQVTSPDQVIFDLDPPAGEDFGRVRHAARRLRALLEDELSLTAYVKTTGGKGLHVHVPLAVTSSTGAGDFDAARDFARAAADVLAAREPGLITSEQRKDKRGGLIYADPMRNAYAQTAVAPYSVRGRPGAPVATPLRWDELDDDELTPARFTLATVPDRLAAQGSHGDPWAGMTRHRYALPTASERLGRLSR